MCSERCYCITYFNIDKLIDNRKFSRHNCFSLIIMGWYLLNILYKFGDLDR